MNYLQCNLENDYICKVIIDPDSMIFVIDKFENPDFYESVSKEYVWTLLSSVLDLHKHKVSRVSVDKSNFYMDFSYSDETGLIVMSRVHKNLMSILEKLPKLFEKC